jgi:hypothetical protein
LVRELGVTATEGASGRSLRPGRIAGEFGLIVVGVLVALAADGWLDRRQEKDLEQQYLAALHDALEADTTALAAGIRFSSRRSSAVRIVLGTVAGDERPRAAEFILGVHMGGQFQMPATEVAVFEELLSSGRFLLLEDPELRRKLLSYYRGVDHPVNERWRNTIWYRYRPVAARVLSPEAQAWASAVLYDGRDSKSVPPEIASEHERTLTLLTQEHGIEGLLQEVASAGGAQVDVWTFRKERAVELLDLIDDSIL